MSDTDEPAFPPERRDYDTRVERDRLAELLGVPPGQLRHMSRQTAQAMIATIVGEEPAPETIVPI